MWRKYRSEGKKHIMKGKRLCLAGMGALLLLGLAVFSCQSGKIQAATSKSNLVNGAPAHYSACKAPEDTKAGGYADAVDYNDNICCGNSSTWLFRNGYVYWSTKSKAAVTKEATLYRSVGWDITLSADLNGDHRIGDDEQIQIAVARTIKGEYLPNMNYFYINYQQRETDGVLYNYSLYAMSYDRLQELAENREAARKNGQTPVCSGIFSASKLHISVDAIMTIVERDKNGNETLKGCIVAENGTGQDGVGTQADGSVTTSGTIYHLNKTEDYEALSEKFNAASIASYRNRGAIDNNKITIEYYVDTESYKVDAASGWSIEASTGQVCRGGKPYLQTCHFWEQVKIADLKSVILGEGCTLTGYWRCGKSGCYVSDKETYHTSYLAQYAEYSRLGANIYNGSGTLKLKAVGSASFQENAYTVQYYSKTGDASGGYSLIGTQNCEYGKTYRYYQASNTSAPVVKGVTLLYWTEGTAEDAGKVECGGSFSEKDYDVVKSKSGQVIRLYAVWGVETYTIRCNQNQPSGSSTVQKIYEIYGIGFTENKALAETNTSRNPYYWTNSKQLVQASGLCMEAPVFGTYIWNGYWDKEFQSQYFTANGKAVFSSPQTFTKSVTIYGGWKKNYTLTVLYRIGEGASLSGGTGYGVDDAGFLTENGRLVMREYLSDETVTLLKVPSGLKKEGCTRASGWRIAGGSESVKGGGNYAAKTLAKKAGADLAKENATVILEIPWSTFSYYVDYYFWNTAAKKYEWKAAQTCSYGETYHFYSERNMGTVSIPTGKVFAGWSKKQTDGTVSYLAGEAFSNLSTKAEGRVSLYGVWTGITYAVSLDGNCPSDSEYPVEMGTEKIVYIYGEGFYQNGESGSVGKNCRIRIPACSGYTFTGYYDAQKGGKQMIDSAGNSTGNLSYADPPKTLYAGWEQKTYRMTFFANGGAFAKNGWGNEQAVSVGGIAYGTFLPATVAPAKTGYSFNGYRTGQDGDGELWYNRFLNSGNRRYRTAGDINLYASWVDDIVPTGIIRASAGNSSKAWTNRDVELTVTGSDAGSGVVKIQLYQKRYFESAYHLIEEWNTAPTASYTGKTTIDANGISNFYCVVYDAAGNTNYRIFGTDSDLRSTVTTSIYVDKVAPRVTVPVLSEAKVGDDRVGFSIYASDDVIE